MSRSPSAEVDFKILIWARNTAGFNIETAAKKIGTTPDRLREWEEGSSYPSVKQLRKLAKAYMRPVGLFFLPELPEDPEEINDFRIMADVLDGKLSSALRFELRLAWERRDKAIELLQDLGDEFQGLHYSASLHDNADHVAKELRKQLQIPIDEQYKWRYKREAFNAWRIAIERLGVLVFQTGIYRNLIVDPMEARGFSISEQPFPVIVVNGKDHPTAKCFTLIHEMTHVLLHNGGLCDLHNPFSVTTPEDTVEVFCNRVAGSLLVPKEQLLNNPIVKNHGRKPEWNDEELGELARVFWVSWEVILRRLLILNKTTRDYYQHWRTERYDNYPGPVDRGDIKIPVHTRVTIRNGHLFPRIVLRAFRNNNITRYEASDLLRAGPHKLDDVEASLY